MRLLQQPTNTTEESSKFATEPKYFAQSKESLEFIFGQFFIRLSAEALQHYAVTSAALVASGQAAAEEEM